MCGIIVSRSIKKFKELVTLNENRGTFSYSITLLIYSDNYEILKQKYFYRNFGGFDFDILKKVNIYIDVPFYLIGHVQAPTGGLIHDKQRIHPSNCADKQYLYHNGILKSKYIKEWLVKDGYAANIANIDNPPSIWDTEILNNNIYKYGFKCLDNVKGSFACILIKDKEIFVFRNNNSILYFDNNMNFSSVKFENSFELKSGEVFRLDLTNNSLIGCHPFQLLDNYYVEI